jgi:E3 ubiquitin-protein ligase XIAP
MCLEGKVIYLSPPELPRLPRIKKHFEHLNMKSEANRRKTYETWAVPFIDVKRLAAAGFYFTNWCDVICCAFCGVEVGCCEPGDDLLKDHQRWSPSCTFVKGLLAGNFPIGPDNLPGRGNDVCGPFMEYRPNSLPERCKYIRLYSFS